MPKFSTTEQRIEYERSLWDAIKVLHGDGFDKYLKIASIETGAEVCVEVGEINPLTMRLVEDHQAGERPQTSADFEFTDSSFPEERAGVVAT
jgi:hypothetical protein